MAAARPNPIILRRVLEETPSVTAAAIRLGVSRPTVYRWMREAGVIDFHRRVRIPNNAGDMPDDGSAA